jgi:spore germination protein GerM
MTSDNQRVIGALAVAGTAVLVGWILFFGLPRWYLSSQPTIPPAPSAPIAAVPRIKAKLFFVAEDGTRLTAVEREVPFGEGTLEQAKRIVEAQLASAPPPLVSAIPAGTALRALYLADHGKAFVDLTRQVSAAHPGGSLNEVLTVYSIVEALTVNLPAITSVQILVDGREVDTLAGHVDLTHPLVTSTTWVERPPGTTPSPGETAPSPAGAGNQPRPSAGR